MRGVQPRRAIARRRVRASVHVLDAESLVRTRWIKTLDGVVADVKFSPDGRYLVAASQERCADVYDCERGYKKISRCAGHSAAGSSTRTGPRRVARCTSCGAYENSPLRPENRATHPGESEGHHVGDANVAVRVRRHGRVAPGRGRHRHQRVRRLRRAATPRRRGHSEG